jgi:hypothetical protein
VRIGVLGGRLEVEVELERVMAVTVKPAFWSSRMMEGPRLPVPWRLGGWVLVR